MYTTTAKKNTFYRPTVLNAQSTIGSEKNPDSNVNCNFAIDN